MRTHTAQNVRGILSLVLMMPILLFSCDKHEDIPIDEFYHFQNVSKITLTKPAQENYFLGIDTYRIPLTPSVKDANGNTIATPTKAITYFANNEKLATEDFLPNKAGRFNLVGKLAGQTSDTVVLNVWDPAALTLRLTTANGTVSQINADNTDSVRFVADLLSGNVVIKGNFPIAFSVNGQANTGRFATATPGDYNFTASVFGIKSNTIKITAVAVSSLPIVRMPVIFHEINTTQLTAAKILELANGMTAAYRNRLNHANQAKDGNAADIFVEFYPAPTGIDGKTLPIPGLDRVTSPKSSFTQPEAYSDAFSYFWEPTRYINIWVYSNITGDYLNASWSYLPRVTSPLAGLSLGTKGQQPYFPYGIFLNARHLVNQNTDEILAHEVGHMLALAHVFDGNGSEYNGCTAVDPDYCGDTPYYDRTSYSNNISFQGTQRFSRISCDGTDYVSTNFMDYYYSYSNSFTQDQRTRVRHAVTYALWLPTPYNNFKSGRANGEAGLVKRPDNLIYVEPMICEFSGLLSNH